MRDFILVVDYLQGPRIYPLDMNEVGLDLQNMNRVGSLNNLLSNRQLSCLEEIYADEVFARYPNVLDLQAYAESVINSASRLRYYSYTSGLNKDELYKIYYEAFTQGRVDFTYAKDVGGIRFVDTKNTEWYHKYNLRPQYYGPDADGGKLAIWFRKVEKEVSKYAEEAENLSKLERTRMYIIKRVIADIVLTEDMSTYKGIIKHCSKSEYPLHRGVGKICSDARNLKPIKGLSKELVMDSVTVCRKDDEAVIPTIQRIAQYYSQVGIYSPSESFDVDELIEKNLYPEENGFLQVGNMLDTALATIFEKYGSNPIYKYAVIMGIQQAFPEGTPDGKLSKRLGNRVKTCQGNLNDFIPNYLKALCCISGYSHK